MSRAKKPESIAKQPLEEIYITSEPETLSNDQPLAKRPKLQKTSFSRFVVSTECSMWKQLDEQIARLFYACNLQLTTKNIQLTTQYFNRPVLTNIDHYGSIDRGGFNRLKPPLVLTAEPWPRQGGSNEYPQSMF